MRNKSSRIPGIDDDLAKLRSINTSLLKSDDPSDREYAMLANVRLGMLESLVEAVATRDRLHKSRAHTLRAEFAMLGLATLCALTCAAFAVTQLVKLVSGASTAGLLVTLAVVGGGLAGCELGLLAAKKLRARWTRLWAAGMQASDDYEATLAVYNGLR